jgi:hypothetical protein
MPLMMSLNTLAVSSPAVVPSTNTSVLAFGLIRLQISLPETVLTKLVNDSQVAVVVLEVEDCRDCFLNRLKMRDGIDTLEDLGR